MLLFSEYAILKGVRVSLTVQGGVPSADMSEKPIREGEWSEGGDDRQSSPTETIRMAVSKIREQMARGGVVALAVFFALGIVFGISAKTLAARSLTMGYWDYMIAPQDISAANLNAIQQKLLAKQAEALKEQEEAAKKAEESAGENGGNAGELPPLPPAPEPPALPEEGGNE